MANLIQKIKDNKVVFLLVLFLVVSLSFSFYSGFKMWYSRPAIEPDPTQNQADYSGDMNTLDCLKHLAPKYIPEGELNKCVKSSR